MIIDHCDLTGNADSGVLIAEGTSDVSDIFIRHCNVSGYGSSPGDAIDVAGSVSNLQVTDCAGYNDLAAAVRTTAPSSSPFSATTYGYYGPATVYGAGSSNLSVTLAGSATTLGNGSFVLGPGQSLTFAIGIGGHTWTTFLMVGQ